MNKNNALTKHITDLEGLDKMLEQAEVLIKSGMVPQKNPEDVVVVMQLAKELNMSVVMALGCVYNIQGKASLGIHLWNALLTTNGVTIELIEDSVPIYHVTKKNGIKLILTAEEVEGGKYYVMSPSQKWDDIKDEVGNKEVVILSKHPSMPNSIVDRRTTIKMTRKNRDGTLSVVKRSYAYHEAWVNSYVYVKDGVVAGKENWIYHVKDMMFARACTRTGKVAGPDYTLGFSEVSEIADAAGEEVAVTEDGDTYVIESSDSDN